MMMTVGKVLHEDLWTRWFSSGAGMVPVNVLASSNSCTGGMHLLTPVQETMSGSDMVLVAVILLSYLHT